MERSSPNREKMRAANANSLDIDRLDTSPATTKCCTPCSCISSMAASKMRRSKVFGPRSTTMFRSPSSRCPRNCVTSSPQMPASSKTCTSEMRAILRSGCSPPAELWTLEFNPECKLHAVGIRARLAGDFRVSGAVHGGRTRKVCMGGAPVKAIVGNSAAERACCA